MLPRPSFDNNISMHNSISYLISCIGHVFLPIPFHLKGVTAPLLLRLVNNNQTMEVNLVTLVPAFIASLFLATVLSSLSDIALLVCMHCALLCP